MLSLRELERAAHAAEERYAGARLARVVQRAAFELELGFEPAQRGGAADREGGRGALLLSCRPRFARVSLRREPAPAPPAPLPFAQYLRAHLEGARMRSARVEGGDRLLSLAFEAREGRFELLLALQGARSNVYLLDGERRLLLSLRPLEETRRDLAGGELWRAPASAPPAPGDDRFAGVPDGDLLAGIEERYAREESGTGAAELRRRIARALERQRAALARKERMLREDLAEGERAAEYGRLGELLKGALGAVRPRASEVRAVDHATGEEVVVPLEPGLSPQENLERLFKRRRKAERQAIRARRELDALAERGASLAELEPALARTDDAGLSAFAERPEIARLLDRYAPAPKPRHPAAPERARRAAGEPPARLLPKRYRSSDGLEIWVGKSDEGNDYLTTRLARGKDLFFHLEGSPGSHVVLRTEGRDDPPSGSLLEACELAVHFSSERSAARADVHVAAIKDVSKPKRAKPGLVHVHRGRTLHLRRDPRRLERILAARIDREEV